MFSWSSSKDCPLQNISLTWSFNFLKPTIGFFSINQTGCACQILLSVKVRLVSIRSCNSKHISLSALFSRLLIYFSISVFITTLFFQKFKCTFSKVDVILGKCFQAGKEVCPTFGVSCKPFDIFFIYLFTAFRNFYQGAFIFLLSKFNRYNSFWIPNKGYFLLGIHCPIVMGHFSSNSGNVQMSSAFSVILPVLLSIKY